MAVLPSALPPPLVETDRPRVMTGEPGLAGGVATPAAVGLAAMVVAVVVVVVVVMVVLDVLLVATLLATNGVVNARFGRGGRLTIRAV